MAYTTPVAWLRLLTMPPEPDTAILADATAAGSGQTTADAALIYTAAAALTGAGGLTIAANLPTLDLGPTWTTVRFSLEFGRDLAMTLPDWSDVEEV